MRPYDDERYLEWFREFTALVEEYLDTEGNTRPALRDEFENAMDNFSGDDSE